MNAAIAAEGYKLRTVRSTYLTLGVVVLAIGLGILATAVLTNDFVSATAEERQHFDVNMAPVVLPIVQLAIATLATLAITSEYSTGLIRTSLLAVPQRGRLFASKIAVVGGLGTLIGLITSFGLAGATWLITADQPATLRPWDSFGDAVPTALATTVTTTVVALVALGLGTALRTTAAGLVTSIGLLFVVPFVSNFLPAAMAKWALSVSLLALPDQLAGTASAEAALTPAGAAIALTGYVLAALTVGWLALSRRDA
jgi:ABC-2 type transport system permease protein